MPKPAQPLFNKLLLNKLPSAFGMSLLMFSLSAHAEPTISVFETDTQNQYVATDSHSIADRPVTIYFINGIFDSAIQAQMSAIALFNRLKDDSRFLDLVESQNITLKAIHNQNDPLLEDLYELAAQSEIQKKALQATEERLAIEQQNSNLDANDLEVLRQAIFNQEIYRANLAYLQADHWESDLIHKSGDRSIERYYQIANTIESSVQAGERVVLVTHSQGNYIAQGVYGILSQNSRLGENLADYVQVVGVANVAATTPNMAYTTHKDDKAVYTWHVAQGGTPMIANFNAIFANGEALGGAFESAVQRQNDSQNHGFVETYLSARFAENGDFMPHSPDIVSAQTDDDGTQQPIYTRIVSQVMSGIERMLG